MAEHREGLGPGYASRPLDSSEADARTESGADGEAAATAASTAGAGAAAQINEVTKSVAAATTSMEALTHTHAALASTGVAAGSSTALMADAAGSADPVGAGGATVLAGHYDLLCGTLNPDSPLALLRGNEHVWTDIFGRVDDWYEQHIDRTPKAYHIIRTASTGERRRPPDIVFPEPTGIHINMMPILLSHPPAVCAPYIGVLNACRIYTPRTQRNQVMYLTIHEDLTSVGMAQRRPGLHIESPKAPLVTDGQWVERSDPKFGSLHWGIGYLGHDGVPSGGIYMASNVANSTRIWPVLIKDPANVTNEHGGMEHMRERLGPGRVLAANEVCWFTDRTPHESLPLQAPESDPGAKHVYRQFFRLVVGQISVWYSKHNTPNPDGLMPDAPISDRDKFADSRDCEPLPM